MRSPPCYTASGTAVEVADVVIAPDSADGPGGWAKTSPLVGVSEGAPPLADTAAGMSQGAAAPGAPALPLGTPSPATPAPVGEPEPLAIAPPLGAPAPPGRPSLNALEGMMPASGGTLAAGNLALTASPADAGLPPAGSGCARCCWAAARRHTTGCWAAA